MYMNKCFYRTNYYMPKQHTKCDRKCPCVVIEVGEVVTLNPDQPAWVDIEKQEGCDYIVSYGIPQGIQGIQGEQGPTRECDCPIIVDGQGCYLYTATDGKTVRCCLVPDGGSGNYRWVCKRKEKDD